jgi:hypothetical protein
VSRGHFGCRATWIALVFLLFPFTGGPLSAQQTALALDLGASYSLPPAGGTGVASTYANGGLRLGGTFGSGGFFHAAGIGGLALSEEGASWASLLAGGGWLQPISRTVSLGLTVAGEAFTVGEPVPYRAAYAQAEPEIGFAFGGTSLRVGGYGAVGSSEVTVFETFIRDTRFGRRVFQVGSVVASDLWAWGGAAEIAQRLGVLTPRLAVEAYESPQGPYVVGRIGLDVRPEVGIFFVEGSWWDTPDGEELSLIAGLRVRTGGKSTFMASGGRYGPDPLLDSPAAGSLGAGVSLELARLGRVPELTWQILAGEEQTLVVALRAPEAASVQCVGEFTSWEAVPMLRDGDVWHLTLPIDNGVHHFGFVVDGEWYVPPEAPGLVEDEWGGMQATIVVGDSAPPVSVTP